MNYMNRIMLVNSETSAQNAQDAEAIASIAKALSHPARVRIITFLLTRPGCVGGDIVDEVGLAQSTVSEHLRILKSSGVVVGEVERPHVCYSLDPAALTPVRSFLESIKNRMDEQNCCHTPQGCIPKEMPQ